MRVITGKYRGRRINAPADDNIRPTTDKIKEALFNILQGDISGAVVVDLFAGTGALGIEALSRGAKKVYFCDVDGRSINLLKSNLTFVDKSEYEILKGDYADCIRRLANRGIEADIVLCDPPYAKKLGKDVLNALSSSGIVKRGGAITIERPSADGAAEEGSYFLEASKKYGGIYLDVYRSYRKCAVTGTFDPFTNGHRFLVEEGLKSFDAVYVVMLVNELKTTSYGVDTRLKMAEVALREFKKRVRIEFYEGFAADYCAEKGIRFIIRGIRTPSDADYERKMADYNYRRGKVETLLLPSPFPEISSTTVKEKLAAGESLTRLVDEEIIRYL